MALPAQARHGSWLVWRRSGRRHSGISALADSPHAKSAYAVTRPWLLMALAMAPPLVAASLRHLAVTAADQSRCWIPTFFAGYAVVWVLAAPIFLVLELGIDLLAAKIAAPPLAVAATLALAWQASPWRRYALELCARIVWWTSLSGHPEGFSLARRPARLSRRPSGADARAHEPSRRCPLADGAHHPVSLRRARRHATPAAGPRRRSLAYYQPGARQSMTFFVSAARLRTSRPTDPEAATRRSSRA